MFSFIHSFTRSFTHSCLEKWDWNGTEVLDWEWVGLILQECEWMETAFIRAYLYCVPVLSTVRLVCDVKNAR